MKFSTAAQIPKLQPKSARYDAVDTEVAGHTDSDGDEKSNLRLSLVRAKAPVKYLVSRNVPAKALMAAGYGESQPIADNSTAEGKAKNRRIVFTPKP